MIHLSSSNELVDKKHKLLMRASSIILCLLQIRWGVIVNGSGGSALYTDLIWSI